MINLFLLQIGLIEEAKQAGIPQVDYIAAMLEQDFDAARAVLDEQIAEDPVSFWANAVAMDHYRLSGQNLQDPAFAQLVDRYVEVMESRGWPWREECDPYFVPDLRETDHANAVGPIMSECHKVFEERLKVNYLCPCTFFNVVIYTLADGRIEEGMRRANQWLDNGDSNAALEYFPLIKLLQKEPGYDDLIARNEAQLERQRDIYASGQAAIAEPRTTE